MDIYLVFFHNNSDEAGIIKEIVEYAVSIIEKRYGLTVFYQSIPDEEAEYPYILINDFSPVYFDKIPDLESIVQLILLAGQTSILDGGKGASRGLVGKEEILGFQNF